MLWLLEKLLNSAESALSFSDLNLEEGFFMANLGRPKDFSGGIQEERNLLSVFVLMPAFAVISPL